MYDVENGTVTKHHGKPEHDRPNGTEDPNLNKFPRQFRGSDIGSSQSQAQRNQAKYPQQDTVNRPGRGMKKGMADKRAVA